jgi:hypothetical protein
MPLPKLGAYFECDMGLVWVVSAITPATDVAEAKVLVVKMMAHEQEMGTMANEWTEAEWDRYRIEFQFTPTTRPPPMLRAEAD